MTSDLNAIAVFVKTPNLSPIKTRLAETINDQNALEFYGLSLEAIQETLNMISAKKYWAVGEQDGLHHPAWEKWSSLWTGDGDLGQRQSHVYNQLIEKHEKIIFLGADCPQISSDFIHDAFQQLDEYDIVIGPAQDGGYYLFGGKNPINTDIWTGVTYSQDTTKQQLCDALGGSIYELDHLCDVDTVQDLPKMIHQMPHNATSTQINLTRWAIELLER